MLEAYQEGIKKFHQEIIKELQHDELEQEILDELKKLKKELKK